MKINKIAIITGMFLLPILINAQENRCQNGFCQAQTTDSGITFTISNIDLDSTDITRIKQNLDEQVKEIESRNKLTDQLSQQISQKCPNITDDQLKALSKNLSEYMMRNKMTALPDDITCNDKSLLALRVSYQRDEGFEWYDWYVEAFDISTGKYLTQYKGELNNKITTFEELELTGDFPPKTKNLRDKQIF